MCPRTIRVVLLDQEIVTLREELSVMNRLARAQDRKFEGSQGYALTRRLWLAEEELRLARSTISALGAEVFRSLYVRSLGLLQSASVLTVTHTDAPRRHRLRERRPNQTNRSYLPY